jgi:hypothetical protein
VLSEGEIRAWVSRERMRVDDIVDPVERGMCWVVISTLEGVLNE